MKVVCILLFSLAQTLDYLGVWFFGKYDNHSVSLEIDGCVVLEPTPLESSFSDEPVCMVIIENGIVVRMLTGQDHPKETCWIKQNVAHTLVFNVDGREWTYFMFPKDGKHLRVVPSGGELFFEQSHRSFASTCIQDIDAYKKMYQAMEALTEKGDRQVERDSGKYLDAKKN